MYGSHLSIAGGMVNALNGAKALKLDTVQVFTKNQRQWKAPALQDDEVAAWLKELKSLGWQGRTVSHATYLMNLASPDPELLKKSVAMLEEELTRCHTLSIPFLVFHPGAHLGQGVDVGLRTIAKAVAPVLRRKVGGKVVLCLENTAGGGTTLGRSFEELASLKRYIEDESGSDAAGRVGFCFDTCHALAAGYDLASHDSGTDQGKKRTTASAHAAASAVLDEFDRLCGLEHLRVLHLNDSKGGRGSHLDRHTHIGHGLVGLGAFAAVVKHPKLAQTPKIMETPKEEDPEGRPWDSVNLAALQRLAKD